MELDFELGEGVALAFIPGQYINVHGCMRPGGPYTGRSYTIASGLDDAFIRIAVRKRGEFSSFLHNLAIGDSVIADGPHGTLCPSEDGTPQVCLAAGIGICPFLSWVRASFPSGAPLRILVTNSTEARSPYVGELLRRVSKDDQVSVTSFLTQQQFPPNHESILRRMNAGDIKQALAQAPDAVISICGSISFTRDMRKAALSLGVQEDRILTEAFF
mgnify:CR=1 FL=1